MKQLDTDTVVEIIKMIDILLKYNAKNCDPNFRAHSLGYTDGLVDLQEHLQEYIEGLVTQAENNLNAGE